MQIKGLVPGMDVPEIEGILSFGTYGRPQLSGDGKTKYQHGLLSDGTGQIRFTLWGDDVGAIPDGARIRVQNAYVREYRDKPQLALSKDGGHFEVIGVPEKAAPPIGSAFEEAIMSDLEADSVRITRLACLKAACHLSSVQTPEEALTAARLFFEWAWAGGRTEAEEPLGSFGGDTLVPDGDEPEREDQGKPAASMDDRPVTPLGGDQFVLPDGEIIRWSDIQATATGFWTVARKLESAQLVGRPEAQAMVDECQRDWHEAIQRLKRLTESRG